VRVVALITRPEAKAAQKLGEKYDYVSLFECDLEGNLTLTATACKFIAARTNRASNTWDSLHLPEMAAPTAHSTPSAPG
jgi:hypothetical protein